MGLGKAVVYQRVAPMFLVGNVDDAVAWYQGVLGAKLQYGLPRTPPYEWASVLLGDVEIMFSQRDLAGKWYCSEDIASQAPSSFIAFVYVRGVSELYYSIRGKAKVIMEPPDLAYGMTEFAIQDPFGFTLTFAEALEA